MTQAGGKSPDLVGCQSWRECLSRRLDGALAVEETRSLEAHLELCAGCRAYDTRLAVAHGALGRLEGRRPVPDALAARIKTIAVEQEARSWLRFRGWGTAAGLLAAGLLLLLAGPWTVPDPRSLPDLCTVMVQDHIRYLPAPPEEVAEVSSALPEEIELWFASRLSFAVRVPGLPDARLVGGRECFLAGQKAAFLIYERERDRRRISLFGFRNLPLGGLHLRSDGSWAGAMHGYRVRAVRSEQITYALVADLPDDEMTALMASLEGVE